MPRASARHLHCLWFLLLVGTPSLAFEISVSPKEPLWSDPITIVVGHWFNDGCGSIRDFDWKREFDQFEFGVEFRYDLDGPCTQAFEFVSSKGEVGTLPPGAYKVIAYASILAVAGGEVVAGTSLEPATAEFQVFASPDLTPTPSPDLVPSAWIDTMDLLVISANWGAITGPDYGDLDRDGTCDPDDLLRMIRSWHTPLPAELPLPFVTIPPGSFLMGNSGGLRDSEECVCCGCEKPRHIVTIDYFFQMGKYEVTVGEYLAVLNWALWYDLPKNVDGEDYDGGDVFFNNQKLFERIPQRPETYSDAVYADGRFYPYIRDGQSMVNHPAKMVTWYGAVAYCNWLSEMKGLPPAYDLNTWALVNPQGGGYRLPSESEWEYACRGSEVNPFRYASFSFGDDISISLDSCDVTPIIDQHMVVCRSISNEGWTERVGSREPNDYGLHDMHGNVYEHCQDIEHQYSEQGRPDDGGAWEDSNYHVRIVRGGGWEDRMNRCRSAHRDGEGVSNGNRDVGFRLVRSLGGRK